jgi:hypothetical protein
MSKFDNFSGYLKNYLPEMWVKNARVSAEILHKSLIFLLYVLLTFWLIKYEGIFNGSENILGSLSS